MDCARCGGFTVAESLSDIRGTVEYVEAIRCLNCGHIEDDVMQARRTLTIHITRQVGSQ
jgi:uncharacterized Zn finger protein